MNLYLVQHAEAKREEEDPDRPLTEKGWGEIRRVAQYVMERLDVQVSQIRHSGKTRARQTAQVLAEYLHPHKGIAEAEGLEPMADPKIWASRLADEEGDAMLVGHLPHLGRLASLLIAGDEGQKVVEFRMGGIACLGRDESGAWSVKWMLTPEVV